jgi:hypothetical protein
VIGFWFCVGIFGGMMMTVIMIMPVIVVIVAMAMMMTVIMPVTLGFGHQTEFATFTVHIDLAQLGFDFPFPS